VKGKEFIRHIIILKELSLYIISLAEYALACTPVPQWHAIGVPGELEKSSTLTLRLKH
jgi:hypothetical protein